MLAGVSIVICCYNSAQRLPQTLAHLASQKVADGLPWEVIVVDNASTDGTAQIAKESWPQESPALLRVVHEPRQGLSHARYRGFTEATYDIIGFIDDDNWVCPEWVQTLAEIMSEHPEVGACGGFNDAVSEAVIPWWFEHYQYSYAVGAQAKEAGDITWTRGFLWGAGLAIRKQAWQQLLDKGFRPLLTDRQGATLTSCGDYEFCLALRSAGWHLWYEPRLRLSHFLPSSRLQWSYLRRLQRGFGASSVGLDPYSFALKDNYLGFKERLERTWQYRTIIVLIKLLRYPHKLILFFYYPLEGDAEIISVEILFGRLSELWRRRKVYELNSKEVWEAPWRVNTKLTEH